MLGREAELLHPGGLVGRRVDDRDREALGEEEFARTDKEVAAGEIWRPVIPELAVAAGEEDQRRRGVPFRLGEIERLDDARTRRERDEVLGQRRRGGEND